jgi:DNA-binding MarR family transcriptional regulator
MEPADRKRLEEVADGFLELFPTFFRKTMREASHPAGRFDPSRIVLRAVQKHGPIRMSVIGRHMGISKPYMTALVDKLISEGLVERVPDPEDRRVVMVRITEAGRQDIRDFMKRARETFIRSLSALNSEDIATLNDIEKKFRSVVAKLDMDKNDDC